MSRELLVRNSDNPYIDRIAQCNVTAIEFADVRFHFPVLQIRDLGDGHPRTSRIADLVRGQRHAEEEKVSALILVDRNVTVSRGSQSHRFDVLSGCHCLRLRLGLARLLDRGSRCICRLPVRRRKFQG